MKVIAESCFTCTNCLILVHVSLQLSVCICLDDKQKLLISKKKTFDSIIKLVEFQFWVFNITILYLNKSDLA